MDAIITKAKELLSKVITWFNSSKKPQDPSQTTYNLRAQTEYQKKLSAFTAENGSPTDVQDAILYAQAYQTQIIKNPSAAKFPAMDEFSVSVNEGTYTVSGYLDATNSYGAQVRGEMKLNLTKLNGKWVCTDKHTDIRTLYMYIVIGSIILSIIGIIYYSAQLSQF